MLLGESGDRAGALRELETTVRYAPGRSRAWLNLARLRREAGDAAGAEAVVRAAAGGRETEGVPDPDGPE
jgi:Flp pilus assembly protein TadD